MQKSPIESTAFLIGTVSNRGSEKHHFRNILQTGEITSLRLKLKTRHMSSTSYHRKKFEPSRWRLWFASQISRRWFLELLPDNTRINSKVYCYQLDKLIMNHLSRKGRNWNRKGVAFHQDTARSHTSSTTRHKLLQLEWEILCTHQILQIWSLCLLFVPISTKSFRR